VQLCDLAYVLMLRRLEQWAMVSYLSAVIAISQGAKMDVPDPADARSTFDAWLASPLEGEPLDEVDADRAETLAALGMN
jgi:hypothetical protein